MSLALLILAQAVAPPAGALPIDFDLARYRPAQDGATAGARACGAAAGGPDEIVVCGRRRQGGDYPMAQWGRIFATRPLVAEIGIARDVRGDVHVESVELDRGAVSNRVMVRLKWPF